jgi:transcriptional regulator with XRE-family HTH domain
MSRRRLQNYLRTHRKRSLLSQKEIAFLLGASSGGEVSKHEHFARQPSTRTVFAYECIFGVASRELFAGLFEEVEEEALKRVLALTHRLEETNTDPRTQRKLEFLRSILRSNNALKHD